VCIHVPEVVPTVRLPAAGAILSSRTTATAHRLEDDDALASIHRCEAWQRPWWVKAA
jgi:hypothetical protein